MWKERVIPQQSSVAGLLVLFVIKLTSIQGEQVVPQTHFTLLRSLLYWQRYKNIFFKFGKEIIAQVSSWFMPVWAYFPIQTSQAYCT